jgi:hypothetical protein
VGSLSYFFHAIGFDILIQRNRRYDNNVQEYMHINQGNKLCMLLKFSMFYMSIVCASLCHKAGRDYDWAPCTQLCCIQNIWKLKESDNVNLIVYFLRKFDSIVNLANKILVKFGFTHQRSRSQISTLSAHLVCCCFTCPDESNARSITSSALYFQSNVAVSKLTIQRSFYSQLSKSMHFNCPTLF